MDKSQSVQNAIQQEKDLQLISKYKNGDIGAFNELVRRYVKHSKFLANRILKEFKETSTAEYHDLVSIGLNTVFISIKSYSMEGGFYYYWKKIAMQKMMEEVKNLSYSYLYESDLAPISIDELAGKNYLLASTKESIDTFDNILLEKVKILLKDKWRGFRKCDIEMFLMYLDGFSYYEIGEKYNMTYFACRKRVCTVKEAIAKILKDYK